MNINGFFVEKKIRRSVTQIAPHLILHPTNAQTLNTFDLPNKESRPHASHIAKLIPTDPVRTSKPDGDTNIPDPTQCEQKIASN